MPTYQCDKCKKEFSHKNHYTRHLNKKVPCDKDKDLSCPVCETNFSTLFNVEKHLKDKHPDHPRSKALGGPLLPVQANQGDVQEEDVENQLDVEHTNDEAEQNQEVEADEVEADEIEANDVQLDGTNPEQFVSDLFLNDVKFLKLGDKKIRKTLETPPRISVYDLITAITDDKSPRNTYSRLTGSSADFLSFCSTYKFSGRGRQVSPVTEAKGAVMLMNLLPGRQAAQFRLDFADVIVRYLGGDETLIADIRRDDELQDAVSEANLGLVGEFHPTSSLELKSVTGVTDFRRAQYYLRQVIGMWSNVHPVGRPQDVLTPEELAEFVVVKAGSQGEMTGRQGTHMTAFSSSRLIDSHITECLLGRYAIKTVYWTSLMLSKTIRSAV